MRFEEAWPSRVSAAFGDAVKCNVIGLNELLQNKRASARPQGGARAVRVASDGGDVDALERLQRLKR